MLSVLDNLRKRVRARPAPHAPDDERP
jgi:hypothetical protein